MTRLRKNSFATLGALAFTAAIALPALAASNDATTPTAPATAQEAPASPGMMQRNMQNMMMQQNIMQQNMMMQQMRQMMRQMHKMMKSMGQKHGAMGKAQGGAMKQGMNKHGAGMTSGNQPSEDCPGMATTPGAMFSCIIESQEGFFGLGKVFQRILILAFSHCDLCEAEKGVPFVHNALLEALLCLLINLLRLYEVSLHAKYIPKVNLCNTESFLVSCCFRFIVMKGDNLFKNLLGLLPLAFFFPQRSPGISYFLQSRLSFFYSFAKRSAPCCILENDVEGLFGFVKSLVRFLPFALKSQIPCHHLQSLSVRRTHCST